MASIRKVDRKDGTVAHTVLFRLENRQRALAFNDTLSAEAFRAAIEAHGPLRAMEMHGLNPTPRRENHKTELTVADWVRTHIDALTGIEQYTLDKYEEYLRSDITARPIGSIPLAKLRESDIATWVDSLAAGGGTGRRARPNGPKTIANKHGFLSAALNTAVKAGHIPSNPAAGRRLPKRKASQDHEMRMLTVDEYDALRTATPPPWQPMLEFMVASGMRWGEVAALQPKHVDIRQGTVRVRQAWKYSPSSGYTLGPPKTKRSRRTINLPADVIDALDLSGDWVFTNQRDGGPVRYWAFRRYVWDSAVAAAGLDPVPTPHDLRHTCASWMLAAGQPITTVSRVLGHENISVTADIYTDVDRTSFKAAADVMAALLKGRSDDDQ
ncbi:tyrosine-type recombinase/integrase [Mycolicibacterium fluoranthenivorans]|uniref:Integrase n=1 Tax=Mycolicibacterium fluoranthenivorans TaxID=258505 RepID=A0A7X5U5Z9_9MYCO|nr:site-specific integrase [Mycolicibacterium fluoranthenivorans]MCV7359157.1 site-specific integrase [Mycolicibacterium fluoranthenivorans]NIH98957.1 integrase [Mycolicibacterium fluoranthenivorans]